MFLEVYPFLREHIIRHSDFVLIWFAVDILVGVRLITSTNGESNIFIGIGYFVWLSACLFVLAVSNPTQPDKNWWNFHKS